jgi:hypothetical protein
MAAVWEVEIWADVASWLQTLHEKEYEHVVAALEALKIDGPALTRPFVDHIKTSRHSNMKELRPRGGNIRLLFAFDPTRTAVVLVAGDKTNNWTKWYRVNIPIADDRFDEHLKDLNK